MDKKLRVSIAQINPTVGDIEGNMQKIITIALKARNQQQADIVIFPEMALVGYPIEDLLLHEELFIQTKKACHQTCKQVKNIYIILGLPQKYKTQRFNSAIVIYNGKIIANFNKQSLTFNEKYYFEPGIKTNIIKIKGINIGIAICKDLWDKSLNLIPSLKKQGAQLIINLNASHFAIKKYQLREKIISSLAQKNSLSIIYANIVGAQDELVFDGGSFVVNTMGKVTTQAPFFKTSLIPITFKTTGQRLEPTTKSIIPKTNTTALIYEALVLGLRDYFEKNGPFTNAIVGISGGIDSALTLAIAVDALGKDRVHALYLPTHYSSNLSATISKNLVQNLKVKCVTHSIEPIYQIFLQTLPQAFSQKPANIVCQNIQARCRGIILMAYANHTNSLVLATGNRSEAAVGYTTLYGDTVGGFAVLKNVPKTLVYKLAKYRNTISHVIPHAAITRPPTAELAPQQKDTDTLPPYPILDKIIEQYVEQKHPLAKIINKKLKKDTVLQVINMFKNSEYKRRQLAPGIKIKRIFNREYHYPITTKFKL